MNTRTWKWLAAGLIAGLSALQAWDSGAFSAGVGPLISALAVTASLIPAASLLLSERRGVHAGAVLAAAALLVTARVVAPVPLPELLLAAVFGGIVLLVWGPLNERWLRAGRVADAR